MQIEFREVRAEIAEIKEILEPPTKAFDVDAKKVVEDDRQIVRIEKQLELGCA